MSNICYVKIDFKDVDNFTRVPSHDPSIMRHHSTFYQHYFFVWFSANSSLRGYVCGIDCSPPLYSIKNRVVDESFLIFIYEGKGTINGIPFKANQFFVIPPNHPTTMISDKDEPWKLCWLSWKGRPSDYFQEIYDRFEPDRIYSFQNAYGMQNIFSSLLYADHSHADIHRTVTYFSDYVISLLSNGIRDFNELEEPVTVNRRKQNYIEKAKGIIAEHYATINISKLSKMLYLNSKYFCQIFHEIVGISPQQYLIDIRLKNSLFYLEDTSMTLKNIAEACGYSSYTGFVDAFKRKYGVSPKEYRKRMKG